MQSICFQQAIAVSNTAQQLPSNPVVRSITIAAPSTNSADIVIGNAPSVTATSGFILTKGESVIIPLSNGNTNALWVVGTAYDVLSVAGA